MARLLTSAQKRKARTELARKRGVSESSVSDYDLTDAVTAGLLSISDYGGDYSDCGSTGSFDGGGSVDCGSGGF